MRSVAPTLAVLLVLAPAVATAAPAARSPRDKPLPWGLKGQPGVMTLVNLHPDARRHTLSSVNYQQQGFLPLCTPVEVLALNGWRMRFRVIETGVEYDYRFHNTLVGKRQAHLEKYFGTQCPLPQIEALSDVDREGIRTGTVMPRMTKEAVVLAIGYPPEHATPSLDLDQWRYWRSRWRTMLVSFENGVVTQIKK